MPRRGASVCRRWFMDRHVDWGRCRRFRYAQDVHDNATTSSAPLRGASLRSLRNPWQRGVPPLVRSPTFRAQCGKSKVVKQSSLGQHHMHIDATPLSLKIRKT